MDAERQKLVARMLKLLALAEGSSFEAEAATARQMAEQLRQQHNLDASEGSKDRTIVEIRSYTPFAKGARWEAIIAGCLAQLCASMIVFPQEYRPDYRRPEGSEPVSVPDLCLVGSIADLDGLFFMLAEVHRQRMKAWVDYKANHGADSFHRFCFGFAQALNRKIERITDAAADRKRHVELAAWFEAKFKTKLNSTDLNRGRASSEAGQDAGRNAALHRGSLAATPTPTPKRLTRS